MGNDTDPRFTKADAEIIKRKAKRLAGHYGYSTSDIEDIEQELATHVFQQTHRHTPERGSREKFVSKVVTNKLRHLIEAKTAKKRDNRGDVPIDHVGGGALIDKVNTPERTELQIDVKHVLDRMPKPLRKIALLRMDHTKAQIEKVCGMTRGEVRWTLQRIEKIFRDANLS